jgi:hypothetical protein
MSGATGTTPLCGHCGKPVIGANIWAHGVVYHPECTKGPVDKIMPSQFVAGEDIDEAFDRLSVKNLKLKGALEFLIEVKEHKDEHGKDQWYQDAQPIAWERARKALKS